MRRTDQRRAAVVALYQRDVTGRPLPELLDERATGFTRELVDGVDADLEQLDALIELYAEDWTVSRMPPIDRNLLRVGVVELLYLDVPAAVTINEAVDLAKLYSTADSGRFVNGILGRIAREATRV